MNGTIAQAVALGCHANGAVAGLLAPPFFPQNSTCLFCDRIGFLAIEAQVPQDRTASPCAETPDDWFTWLSTHGCVRVNLGWEPSSNPRIPDRNTAGFVGGGGRWYLDAVDRNARVIRWTPRWEVWNSQAPNRRIWRVSYLGARVNRERQDAIDLSLATRELKEAVTRIRSFADALSIHSECFSHALDTLNTGRPHGYHKDLAPQAVLSQDAIRLLDASQSAWVFGGMGSWNDIGVDAKDQEQYVDVSESLFRALTSAIPAAVNSFASKCTGLGA